ncbi:MAG: ABC transporter ATP-binding protein [Opitutaceae bacterium]
MEERGEAPAIEVQRLTKIYRRDVPLHKWLRWGLGIGSPGDGEANGKTDPTGHYALRDIAFSVWKGEAFGVVGRNGAGKSTLLQIVAGTLQATSGQCAVRGRVTALLELGSGFNPEFTGRENIYLAGSILGISREEMDRKFDEIERFAEVGEFMDQPVRTYSTGMLMRIAFSVAVAVDPDILIVDEALSVGDILFQQKCNRKMRELLASGVTLLVVTHDTGFVLNLCQRAMWLHEGASRYLGDASACVREYLAAMAAEAGNDTAVTEASDALPEATLPSAEPLDLSRCERLGDGGIYVDRIWLLNEAGEATAVFRHGEWCRVVALVRTTKEVRMASAGCEVRDRHGQVLFATGLRVVRRLIDSIASGEGRTVVIKFKMDLAPGRYSIDIGCGAGDAQDNTWQRVVAAAVIEVSAHAGDDIVHGLVRLPYEVAAYRV